LVKIKDEDGEDQTLYPIAVIRWGTYDEWSTAVSEQIEWSEALRAEVIALNAARIRRQVILEEIQEMKTSLS
tara:strand:+ start:538 stop:753 length:216 start_codon:yes stop_codon:yes gene_type:complete